ncbi:MAG: DUF4032 domain-containing protein [Actinobacteria bacterium]|nr:DUF4032 domain-containing protein [Actinomycetota bacterium]
MAVRLQFIPRQEPPDLLDLPWGVPLVEWEHPRLVRMAQGLSRHVVRCVSDGDRVYALKEMIPEDAAREYGMLRLLAEENLPVVAAVGLVTGRQTPGGQALGAVLVTRYLDFALPYRYLFGIEGGYGLSRRLVDAAVVLLVRVHVEGFYWGDCSLSNLLFRRDAGALKAYLVDAETTEHRRPLPEGMRLADLDLARENVAGGLLDLEAEGLLSPDIDVLDLADLLEERYRLLWDELTATLEVDMGERHLIEGRIRRLNDLGFDVGELIVEHEADGDRLRVTPVLAQAVVAARWIAEVYEPIVERIPPDLAGRREPAELFHELLEHRYYLSEAAGHEVDNDSALRSYLQSVLRFRPQERVILDAEE